MPNFSRPGAFRPSREKNFSIVSGLPEHFNWQKLKDLVRDATTNQPGWTNMNQSWHGPEGGKGYFSVKSDQDAASVYHLLVVVMYARLGRPLLVHHFDASRRDPILLMCNCSAYYPGATGHSANRSRITARSVLAAQNIPDWQPIATMPFVTIPMQHPGMTVPITVPQVPMYTTAATYYPAAPAIAMPANPPMTNEHGLPINTANGVVRTESRGVHLSGLRHGVSEGDLRELLRPCGRVLGVTLQGRGSAVVRFGSVEEVRLAIERLDHATWRGRQISVKEDRDATSVSEPVIVDGRNGLADR